MLIQFFFLPSLKELEKRKEKLRIESNYQNRKNMDKIRADYNNANKQFQNKYTEITTLLDPTFMATILTLSKAFFDMKAQYDTASQLEERVGALEKRVESSAAAAKKVAKEGYLSMKTTFSWQREYFMIKDGRFLHLTPGKVATPYVVTAVRLYNQKAAAMKFIDADRCLEVVCDKRKSSYVLQAQSKQERDAWFSEVSSIVVAPAPPPQPPAAAATTTTTTTTSATATTTASSASTTATAAAPVAITVSAGSTASSSGTPIISPTPQQGAQKQLSLDGESQTMSPSLFRRRGRFASVSGPNTGGSKRRSKSPENPRSASPGDYAPHLTWEELKAGDLLQKPVSYTKRASNRGSDARNIKLAGIPPWALTSVAKGSESAERLPLFPPLTLDSFYKEFTYVESNSAALHHADRSEDIFASSNTDTASNCDTASSSSSSSSSYTTTTTAAAGGSGMTVILNAPSPNFSHSHTLSQGQALGIAAATASAGAGELHEHQSRLRSYSTVVVSSPSTSSSFSPSSPSSSAGLNDDSCRASVNITVAASAAAQPQVQCSPIMSFQGRKRTTTLRRKKTVVEEMPEIPDDFAIDTDKVTEGLTFAELVKRLSETDKGVTLIEGEAVKTDDLEKLNGAVETLHLIKGHLTFMSGESFEPAATVDEAKKRISESVPELRDNIKEIASSLKLVVPDNSSTWAFYVQPIEDAYNSFMKYKSKP